MTQQSTQESAPDETSRSTTTSAGASARSSARGPRTTGPAGSRSGGLGSAGLGALGVLLAVVLWWIFTHAAGAGDPMMAAFQPERMPGAFASLQDHGVLLSDAGVSLFRLFAGLLIAVAAGIPLGLAVGSWRVADGLTHPIVQFLRMVSPLSWAPVAVAVFGVGHAPVVFLVAIAAVWPIVLNTSSGVRAVDPGRISVARVLGARPFEVLRHVILPSVRGHVMTGIRTALGISWVIIVPAEMLGDSSGLGYEILNARDRLAYDEMLAVILTIGVLGIVLDGAARLLLRERLRRS